MKTLIFPIMQLNKKIRAERILDTIELPDDVVNKLTYRQITDDIDARTNVLIAEYNLELAKINADAALWNSLPNLVHLISSKLTLPPANNIIDALKSAFDILISPAIAFSYADEISNLNSQLGIAFVAEVNRARAQGMSLNTPLTESQIIRLGSRLIKKAPNAESARLLTSMTLDVVAQYLDANEGKYTLNQKYMDVCSQVGEDFTFALDQRQKELVGILNAGLEDLKTYVDHKVKNLEISIGLIAEDNLRLFEQNARLQTDVSQIKEFMAMELEERVRVAQAQNATAKIAGFKASAQFISMLGSYFNSKEMMQIGAVVSTGAQISEALLMLQSVSGLAVLGPYAALGMAALTLVQVFSSSSSKPTIDEIILGQLRTIEKQIHRLSEAVMHSYAQIDVMIGDLAVQIRGLYKEISKSTQMIVQTVERNHQLLISYLSGQYERYINFLSFVEAEQRRLFEYMIFIDLKKMIFSLTTQSEFYYHNLTYEQFIAAISTLNRFSSLHSSEVLFNGAFLLAPDMQQYGYNSVVIKNSILSRHPATLIGYLACHLAIMDKEMSFLSDDMRDFLQSAQLPNLILWLESVKAMMSLISNTSRFHYLRLPNHLEIAVQDMTRPGKDFLTFIQSIRSEEVMGSLVDNYNKYLRITVQDYMIERMKDAGRKLTADLRLPIMHPEDGYQISYSYDHFMEVDATIELSDTADYVRHLTPHEREWIKFPFYAAQRNNVYADSRVFMSRLKARLYGGHLTYPPNNPPACYHHIEFQRLGSSAYFGILTEEIKKITRTYKMLNVYRYLNEHPFTKHSDVERVVQEVYNHLGGIEHRSLGVPTQYIIATKLGLGRFKTSVEGHYLPPSPTSPSIPEHKSIIIVRCFYTPKEGAEILVADKCFEKIPNKPLIELVSAYTGQYRMGVKQTHNIELAIQFELSRRYQQEIGRLLNSDISYINILDTLDVRKSMISLAMSIAGIDVPLDWYADLPDMDVFKKALTRLIFKPTLTEQDMFWGNIFRNCVTSHVSWKVLNDRLEKLRHAATSFEFINDSIVDEVTSVVAYIEHLPDFVQKVLDGREPVARTPARNIDYNALFEPNNNDIDHVHDLSCIWKKDHKLKSGLITKFFSHEDNPGAGYQPPQSSLFSNQEHNRIVHRSRL